jgi:ABC-type multidrug transport system fused ATPase/permease subunit
VSQATLATRSASATAEHLSTSTFTDPDVVIAANRAFVGRYGGYLLGALCLLVLRAYGFAQSCALASRFYTHELTQSVLHAPTTYFDGTPSGRLLNRFASDIDAVRVKYMALI